MPLSQRPLFWAKAFYFLYYAAAASLLPFLALYFESLGLNGRQIGFLAGIPPLVGLFGAPLWSGLADASRRYKLILTVAIVGAIGFVLLLSRTRVFILLVPIVAVYAFLASPILPLVDNAVMGLLAKNKEHYGRQRIWGAVGWGLAAPLIGQLIETSGLLWSFAGYAATMIIGLVAGWRIPLHRAGSPSPFWQGARTLISNRSWLMFLFLVFVGGMGQAVIHNFLFLYMNELGASKTLMGFALTVATLSELPIFFLSGRLLARWSTRRVLIFSTLMFVVRALALSFVIAPWLVLMTQLLHGVTFSAMWVAGVSYADEIAPSGLGATAQGVLSGVMMGLATAVGAFLGGALYQDLGGAMMYRIMALIVAASILLFIIAQWWFNKDES